MWKIAMTLRRLLSLVFCALSLTARPGAAAPRSFVRQNDLINLLLTTYSANVPPSRTNITVRLTLNLFSVVGPSVGEEMQVDGEMTLAWAEPRLMWNPKDWAGVEDLTPAQGRLWTPPLAFVNARQPRRLEAGRLQVSFLGAVTWQRVFQARTACSPASALFPSKALSCPLLIGTGLAGPSKALRILLEAVSIDVARENPVGAWIPAAADLPADALLRAGPKAPRYGAATALAVSLRLQRRPDQLSMLLILPFVCLSFIGALLPLAMRPAQRLSIALLLLLCMGVHLGVVTLRSPGSAQVLPLLCVFLATQMVLFFLFSFASTLFSALRMADRLCPGRDRAASPGGCWKCLKRNFGGTNADLLSSGMYALFSALNICVSLLIIPFGMFREL